MAKNFSQFTQEASPALSDHAVGYRTAASGGERRTLWSAIYALFKTSFDGVYQPLAAVLTATTAAFTTEQETKLSNIETAATADQTGAEIKALYEAESDTNAFTDAEKASVAFIRKTYVGATDPDANTDTTGGYAVGSLGFNTSTGLAFWCSDASEGAAVWQAL